MLSGLGYDSIKSAQIEDFIKNEEQSRIKIM